MKSLPVPGKIELIQKSIRCLVYGSIGLVPILGIPFAVRALSINFRVKRTRNGNWNPGERQMFLGRILAWLGLLLTFVVVLLVIYNVLFPDNGSGGDYYPQDRE
jgi:hypothetical protein